MCSKKPVKKKPETNSKHPEAHEPEDEVNCEDQELEEGETPSMGRHPDASLMNMTLSLNITLLTFCLMSDIGVKSKRVKTKLV